MTGKVWARRGLELAILVAAYYLTGRAGLQLAASNKNVTTIWPPTGIAVAALVLRGRWLWPGVYLGGLLTNLGNGAGWETSLGIGVGNTLAPLLAATLLTRVVKFSAELDSVRDVVALLVAGGMLSMVVSASLGNAVLVATGLLSPSDYWSSWMVWWLGDAMGVVLFAPVILTLFSIPSHDSPAVRHPASAVNTAVIFLGITFLIFTSTFPIRYLTIPLVCWAALRFRQQGAALGAVIVTSAAGWSYISDWGPTETGTTALIGLLLLSSAAAVSGLVLAAVETERVRSREALELATAMLEERVAQRTLQLDAARTAAEAASNAKSEYLSRMSHELRTPLTAIIGFSELMFLENPEAKDRHLQSILKAADHLEALVDDALDIARIEAGKVELSLEPVDLTLVTAEALELLSPVAAEGEVTLKFDAQQETCLVLADEKRLTQVIVNLLTNAIKYGGQSACLSITKSGQLVRLNVTDQGTGLDHVQMAALFQPFERVGAERTGVQGTGLGLALSKRLIDAMGADIGVESQPGAGSTFWIELVSAAEPSSSPHPADIGDPDMTAGAANGYYKVLSIEDNSNITGLLTQIFKLRPNVELVSTAFGGEALDLAKKHEPDLILLDLHLPDLDGELVIKELQSDRATAKIPVVVMSADAIPQQIQRLRLLGAYDYITKPIRIQSFLHTLDETLAANALAKATTTSGMSPK